MSAKTRADRQADEAAELFRHHGHALAIFVEGKGDSVRKVGIECVTCRVRVPDGYRPLTLVSRECDIPVETSGDPQGVLR